MRIVIGNVIVREKGQGDIEAIRDGKEIKDKQELDLVKAQLEEAKILWAEEDHVRANMSPELLLRRIEKLEDEIKTLKERRT